MNLNLLPLSDTWVLPRPFAVALRGSTPRAVRHAAAAGATNDKAEAAPALWQTSLAEIETARRSDRIVAALSAGFGLLVVAAVAASGIATADLLGPRGIEFVVNTLLMK